MNKEEYFLEIDKIINSKDNYRAWEYFDLKCHSLTSTEQNVIEIKLMEETWHKIHEELVSGFQRKKDPEMARHLYKWIIKETIPEFDYKPVTRRCTWALADIGTDEAKYYLYKLTSFPNEYIQGFAHKRLKNWEREIRRKGQQKNGSYNNTP